MLGTGFQFSGSAFYSRFSNLIQPTAADLSYAGLYHGWPVDYIDFPVNEGHAVAYGGALRSRLLARIRCRAADSQPTPLRRWPTGDSGRTITSPT